MYVQHCHNLNTTHHNNTSAQSRSMADASSVGYRRCWTPPSLTWQWSRVALSSKSAAPVSSSMGELSYSAGIPRVDAFTTQHTSVLRGAWAQCEAVGASGVGGQSGGGVDKVSSTSSVRWARQGGRSWMVRGDERVGGCVELTGQRGRAQKRVSAWRSHTWFSSLLFRDYILDFGIGASRLALWRCWWSQSFGEWWWICGTMAVALLQGRIQELAAKIQRCISERGAAETVHCLA